MSRNLFPKIEISTPKIKIEAVQNPANGSGTSKGLLLLLLVLCKMQFPVML